jgi:hypothetical protein
MKNIHSICLAFVLLLLSQGSLASHVLGGELTYKCLGGGLYEFNLRLYRDCNGVVWNETNQLIQHNVPGLPAISMTRLPGDSGVFDVSPGCPGSTVNCGGSPTNGSGPAGAVGVQVYRGYLNMSTAPAPPAVGYVFTMNSIQINVRNNNNNMSPQGSGMTLRVIMYPYVHPSTGRALTPAQMCDNAPSFSEPPLALQTLNPLDTVTFSNFATDVDQDSISFHMDLPWRGVFTPLNFNGGFSLTHPWPGIIPVSLGPPTGNVAIHPAGGVITFSPTTQGNWLACIRVDAWRCGQRIASSFRDIQIRVVPAQVAVPVYNPANPSPASQRAPQFQTLFRNRSTGSPQLNFVYYAGDTVVLPVMVSDNHPTITAGNVFNPDSVFLTLESTKLSGTNSVSTGCDAPPCMTIRGLTDPNPPAPPVNAPQALFMRRTPLAPRFLGLGYKGILEVGAKMVWLPDCRVFGSNSGGSSCMEPTKSFLLAINATDDNCPIVGVNQVVYNITIKKLPPLSAPRFVGVNVDQTNTFVQLHFQPTYDSVSIDPLDTLNIWEYNAGTDSAAAKRRSVQRRLNSFKMYRIYRAASLSGPFVPVDSLTDIHAASWVDTNVSFQQGQEYFYYITTISSCDGAESMPSDTLKTIKLVAVKITAATGSDLAWDNMFVAENTTVNGGSSTKNFIEFENYSMFPGLWTTLDSTLNQRAYTHFLTVGADSLNYRVGQLGLNRMIFFSPATGLGLASSTSIAVPSEGRFIKIYPNPFSSFVVVESALAIEKVEVFDMKGRAIGATLQYVLPNTVHVDLGTVAKGLYRIVTWVDGMPRHDLLLASE